MPFQIIREDITRVHCDAIVNAANRKLCGGGGVDGAIHAAAGEALQAECLRLGSCEVGQAKLTKGYRLPCRYVIHTVGPRWAGGGSGEPEQLASCYRESLRLAQTVGCESVAFPLISSGAFAFPRELALQIAMDEIRRFLSDNDMLIYLVVFDRECFQVSKKLIWDITEYIDERYAATHLCTRNRPLFQSRAWNCADAALPQAAIQPPQDLNELLSTMDESFSQMLLRKIDERGISDAACYKKANIDRKLFSKIRSDPHYKPSKPTALAFAIALELPLWEAQDMLRKAGFALSHSNKFDVILEYFIQHQDYDIFRINETLFAFDQPLLGA